MIRNLCAVLLILILIIQGYSQSPRLHSIPFDSLRSQVTQAQTAKDKLDAYIELGSALARARMSDSLFHYSQQIDTTDSYGKSGKHFLEGMGNYNKNRLIEAITSLELARHEIMKYNMEAYFTIQNTLGICYIRTNSLGKAKEVYEDMLAIMGEEIHPRKSGVYGNLGKVHRNLGDYNKAIEFFEKCVELNPEDAFTVANSYMNIANMFYNLEMFDKAVATLHMVDSTQIINTPVYIAYNGNLGDNYYKSGQFALAKRHFQIARVQAKQLRQYHMAVKPNLFLAKMAIENNNLEEAKARLDEGLDASNQRPYLPMQVAIGLGMAEYYLKTKQPDSSIYFANEMIKLATKSKSNHTLLNVYEILSKGYEQLNDKDKSNQYLRRHNAFTDSINNAGRQRLLADARARYEVKETQDALKETEEDVSFFENLTLKISFAVIILIALSVFLYVRFFKQKQVNELNQEEITDLNRKLEEVHYATIDVERTERLLLKSKTFLEIDDIMYIKSDGPYVEFYINSKDRPEIDRNTLKSLTKDLPSMQFVQVHRSYIVNIKYVRSIYASKLMLKTGEDINISRSFKANIEKILVMPTDV